VTRRVLVADDSADMRESLKLVLERAGYEVRLAADGSHALEMQRAAPCDVLITDIFMPECDGLETITGFRREFPAVKIIAMSGGGLRIVRGQQYLQTAQAAGADATLNKPFDPKSLLQVLQDFASTS
jgi:CheY-like chemotaxis protein